MDTAKDTPAEQHRMEKEDIEDLGTVTLTRGGHVIHCLTVIGQIEGHTEAPQGQKTTKYEHVIPQLVAVQEDPRIEGLLVLLNTVGGDVEAGLALAEMIASRFNDDNTELVDINHMRTEKQCVSFAKLQATGDDYIFVDNRASAAGSAGGVLSCPESLCIGLCDRHYGVGADGLVLIEDSDVADARMRIFNRDGSEGRMAGNCIRSVGKYLYDKGIVPRFEMKIETSSGIKSLRLYTRDDRVTMVDVDMGKAVLEAEKVPVICESKRLIGAPVTVGGVEYRVSCLSVGNPHCVVFCDRVDEVDIEKIGPQFENAPIFPERVNTEFVRVVNKNMLKMRVWERGNGETLACGTGACAAVVAAVENGYCRKGEDVVVKLRGGDLTVNYRDEGIVLSGDTRLVFEGTTEI